MAPRRARRPALCALLLIAAAFTAAAGPETPTAVRIERLLDAPIISPALHPSIGENIQGPSLLRVPDWVPEPLGRYYLYFADHKGRYIRLAYSDDLLGPWRVHAPGSLHIEDSHFLTQPPAVTAAQEAELLERFRRRQWVISHDWLNEFTTPHIASPDVHADHARREAACTSTGSTARATK